MSFQIPKGEQLKKYREKKGKPVSEMIREAVSWFVEKIDYRVDTGVFCLPKTVRDNYTSLTTYFLGSNWDLRVGIFRKTGRCKTDLIREAIRKYWDETG